jgi:uridine phosphorylase
MLRSVHGCEGGNRGKIRNLDVLVCYAVKEEVGFLVTRFDGCNTLVTGMGKGNAAESIQSELALNEYRLVLTCGFAGGLNPNLAFGTVIFDEDTEAGLETNLIQLGAAPAKFYCAKRVAVTVAEKKDLWNSTGADAVEMESSVIRTVCREKKIPSATIRVILDTAQEDLPLDFNALMTSFDRINYPKLVWTILCKPHKVFPLWKFQRKSAVAAVNLDKIVRGILRM